MNASIQTFALSKRFPTDKGWRGILRPADDGPLAVDQVNFFVQTGELFGLLGPNGAGKTTLIKMLSTLIVPTSGEARVNGYALHQEEAIKQSIGLATSDERSFYWRLTGRQNLLFFANLHGLYNDVAIERVDTVLQQVSLQEVANRRFQTYSTGMRQRLSIARALLSQPRLLFLDEPTKGLDLTSSQQVHHLIQKLRDENGITVFLTTHLMAEAEKLCDRVAVMNAGRIHACGTTSELRGLLNWDERYQIQVAQAPVTTSRLLENCLPQARWLPGQSGSFQDNHPVTLEFEASDEESLNLALDTLRNDGVPVQSIQRVKASLEEIISELLSMVRQGQALPTLDPIPQASLPTPGSTAPTNQSLKDRLRVALAFLRRDLVSEASYRISFLLQFFGVFLSAVMFYFIGKLLGEAAAPFLTAYGGDYFAFVLIGIAFASYFSVGLSSFSSSLRQAQTAGTLEAMLTTPTGLSTVVLSSSIWEYFMTTLRVVIYLAIGAVFLGVSLEGGNYLGAVLVLLLTIVVFSSMGVLAASFIMVLKRGDPITWIFSSASSLLGGVYYPITVLPEWLQWIAKLLPITYTLQAMRLALLSDASIQELAPYLLVLFLFGIVLLPLSLMAFRFAVRRARIDGSLTHY